MSLLVILTPHQQKTASIIFKLRDEFGQTFVIVTHNANMADLVMVDGQISN
jgi:predicted ABC-type transport system involved in lysophospholipase L1 biosynthesis ATPase subunit